jgi:hypothetical protein
MAELEFGKSVDEIEAPVLLPEGWRMMELTEEPKVEPNAAFKEDPNAEKAGHNWVVRLVTADDDPAFNGRRFTLWLGVPKPADSEKYTQDGQKVYDAKMQRIVDFVEAFGGHVGGSKVSIAKGARGQCYVLQQINKGTGEVENSIDIFNQGFKPAGA